MEADEFGQKRKVSEDPRAFKTFTLLVCFKNKRNGNSTRFEHRYRRCHHQNKHLHQPMLMVDRK